MKTILVVEDDLTLNKNITFALESAGFEVLSANNLAKASQLCNQCDLILLDVILPDGNGIDFCKSIRQDLSQPIIFLTSCDEDTDIVKGLDFGGDDYITKPFRLNVLLSRIKAILRRCTADFPDIELTALEEKLLNYLILNKEQFLTRDQILAYLWDSKGIFVNDNTLSVNISRLRDKLKECPNGQIITKRGLGYKWTTQTSL